MSQERIAEIIESRRNQAKPAEVPVEGEKFFSVLLGEGVAEQFLELQFANGIQSAFSYEKLEWFNHDPDAASLDCQFGGFLISIRGRGLRKIFQGLKGKRVAWVKEADSTMQDNPGNDCYIEEIVVIPPSGFEEE